jgi:hypothetical protein
MLLQVRWDLELFISGLECLIEMNSLQISMWRTVLWVSLLRFSLWSPADLQ